MMSLGYLKNKEIIPTFLTPNYILSKIHFNSIQEQSVRYLSKKGIAKNFARELSE